MHAVTSPSSKAIALDAPSPLSAAVRAEWTKLRTVRAAWLTMSIAIAAAIILSLLNSLSDVRTWDELPLDERLAYDATSTTLVGVLFGALALGALGVRTITSEYSSGMIRSTMAAVPRRADVLIAKVLVVTGSTLVVSLIANVAGFTIGQGVLRTEGIHASAGDADSLAAMALGALAVSAFAATGVGLGALVRRASVANILIALVVIGGQIVGTAVPSSSQRFLPFNALQATVTVHRGDDLLPPLQATTFICVYATVAVLAAAVVLNRRDV
jgi:ABC-type transport system involved in multi-copper enzyme maturation permease subunit